MVDILLKASLVVTILWAFYKLFLERESFFAANRIYLLGCLVLAFVLPFVSLPRLVDQQGFVSGVIERAYTAESPAVQAPVGNEDDIPNAASQDDKVATVQTGLTEWIGWLYWFGVSVFALNLIIQIGALLLRAGRSADKVRDSGGIIVNAHSVLEPHSFFRYIFIDPGRYDYDTYEQILSHEKIHVRKRHAVDLLLAEVAVAILWFNPFMWLLRKEIEKNVEYETDDAMLDENSARKEEYQMNLLRIATRTKPFALTTNYNQSLIKQRIFRMNARKSSPHNYWKYAFAGPLLFATLLVINRPLPALAGDTLEPVSMGQENNPAESASSGNCRQLLRAVKSKNEDDVKSLLETVDPNCEYRGDGEPRTALVAAARLGYLSIGELLVEAGADVEFHAGGDETPLMAAAANGRLDFVRFLVERNAEINKKLKGDGSALLVAAREGHLEVVKYLIGEGADVNSQVTGDGTPLICSVRHNHLEVSRVLLENGADPYQISPGDEYAMYHARMSSNKAIIDLLKKYEKDN